MGGFKYLVNSPAKIEAFKNKYHIPQEVVLRYCSPEQLVTDRERGEVIIPMIAYIEEGMTILMGRITQDYLLNHRICPHQCAPNLFRVLGSIDVLNEHLRLGLTWHDVVHMYECHSLKNAGFYLKSRSDIVRLVSCLPKSNKGMKDDYLIALGVWHDGFPCSSEKESQVGYLRVRLFSKRSRFFDPDHVTISLSSYFLLVMNFSFLFTFCFSATFANKGHVAPRLSLTNVATLNYLLRSEIFVSEDRQLRAVHLILDFQPISEIYQDVGNVIRMGDPRLAQIDISRPNFLARDNLPPVALPLPQILPKVAAAPEKEIASLRLSLEEEIDKFHFDEEENSGVPLVTISDAEGEADRHSGVHTPLLVTARPDSSFKEEEDSMTLNKGNKSLRELMASWGKVLTSQEVAKSQIPTNLLFLFFRSLLTSD